MASSKKQEFYCQDADLVIFQNMADTLSRLRFQNAYSDSCWKMIFDACDACREDPSGCHPEQVKHVFQSLSELRELRMLALLVGQVKFHGSRPPSEEQLEAERRFRRLAGLGEDSKK